MVFFFLYGGVYGDDSCSTTGSIDVTIDPAFVVVSTICMARRQGKNNVRLVKRDRILNVKQLCVTPEYIPKQDGKRLPQPSTG